MLADESNETLNIKEMKVEIRKFLHIPSQELYSEEQILARNIRRSRIHSAQESTLLRWIRMIRTICEEYCKRKLRE